MSKGTFNLLYEKWILARDSKNQLNSYSILDLFEQSPNLRTLAGELPTQDVAVLRLLLAVLHRVFYLYAPDGTEIKLSCPEKARDRWKELWDLGEFPMEVIKKYLLKYEDRFYLFHDEHPFLQIKGRDDFTKSDGIKSVEKNLFYFIGEIAQSQNKKNLFLSRLQEPTLSYDEAARWLIHLNGFDLPPVGNPGNEIKKIIGYGSAWLSNLGLVYIQGNNLFETLMFNFILAPEDADSYSLENNVSVPVWEEDTVIDGSVLKNTNAPIPKTFWELYSMRFRYLELVRNPEKTAVTGVRIWSGRKFKKLKDNKLEDDKLEDDKSKNNELKYEYEDVYPELEPMTLWDLSKSNNLNKLKPRLHSTDKLIWQDFGALIIPKTHEKYCRPGVLKWICTLKQEEIINTGFIRLKIVGQELKDKNGAIKDVFSDGLTVHTLLIKIKDKSFVLRILNEIEKIEKIANAVQNLSRDLERAKGADEEENKKKKDRNINKKSKKAREQIYSRLDVPFRKWLESLNPETDNIEEKCEQWRQEAKRIVEQFGEELVANAGPKAMAGRYRKNQWFTAPKAHLEFRRKLKKII